MVVVVGWHADCESNTPLIHPNIPPPQINLSGVSFPHALPPLHPTLECALPRSTSRREFDPSGWGIRRAMVGEHASRDPVPPVGWKNRCAVLAGQDAPPSVE